MSVSALRQVSSLPKVAVRSRPVAATTRGFATPVSRSKEEKDAIIMRLRKNEEDTRKYGAPKGQALLVTLCGISAVGLSIYGWSYMDPRLGSIRSRGGF
eukprot:CAMPEP_0181313504 /NCGR_PEP_ID=MMETSP1101-20121128/14282_1 /TAXON_ID=46948 /ORGANISM="Rhodomonas abbreviata, Strain Caron Lab Isolate" /LENGTH=98 /DNA_ID=CAMNT_0023420459 /DNA_START=182 /DNA_END=478 /DNA_ORIENTATION=+